MCNTDQRNMILQLWKLCSPGQCKQLRLLSVSQIYPWLQSQLWKRESTQRFTNQWSLKLKTNVYSTTTKKYIFDVDSTMAFPLECSHKVNLYLKQGLSSAHSNAWKQFSLNFITFDRIHTIYIVFQPCRHYSVPWVLMTDARPFHAFAAILDWLTHLASISCWHWSNARQDEFSCFIVNFKSTRLWSCRRRWSASKKNITPSYKPTKHIKYTFLICDYYCSSYMYIVMLLT